MTAEELAKDVEKLRAWAAGNFVDVNVAADDFLVARAVAARLSLPGLSVDDYLDALWWLDGVVFKSAYDSSDSRTLSILVAETVAAALTRHAESHAFRVLAIEVLHRTGYQAQTFPRPELKFVVVDALLSAPVETLDKNGFVPMSRVFEAVLLSADFARAVAFYRAWFLHLVNSAHSDAWTVGIDIEHTLRERLDGVSQYDSDYQRMGTNKSAILEVLRTDGYALIVDIALWRARTAANTPEATLLRETMRHHLVGYFPYHALETDDMRRWCEVPGAVEAVIGLALDSTEKNDDHRLLMMLTETFDDIPYRNPWTGHT